MVTLGWAAMYSAKNALSAVRYVELSCRKKVMVTGAPDGSGAGLPASLEPQPPAAVQAVKTSVICIAPHHHRSLNACSSVIGRPSLPETDDLPSALHTTND